MSELQPCPACPDGYVWNNDGPTGKCCPVCGGHACLNLDGSQIQVDADGRLIAPKAAP